MTTRKKAKPAAPKLPQPHAKMATKVYESFSYPDERECTRSNQPSTMNGCSIHRYRVTVEEIEEPLEVLQGRIRKLWRLCDNHHEWDAIQRAAAEHGIAPVDPECPGQPLDHAEAGVDVRYEYTCEDSGREHKSVTKHDRWGNPDCPTCGVRMSLHGRVN